MTEEIDIVVGLGFGDETKGSTVSYLAEKNSDRKPFVVRFSGGPQTLHHTVLEDGTVHGFSQFGSGTFSGAPTVHTRFSMINPLNMVKEADCLQKLTDVDPLYSTIISENSPLITTLQTQANKKREVLRGNNPHGSCGEGIGETMSYLVKHPQDAPYMKDVRDPDALTHKLNLYNERLEAELGEFSFVPVEEIISHLTQAVSERAFYIMEDSWVNQHISKQEYLIFEGTQGILLDEWNGFHPHTTWATTTSKNALTVIEEAGINVRPRTLGITRTYHTRHGYGPFPSENHSYLDRFPEKHNKTGRWQGDWRAGPLDLSLLDYAVRANGGIDEIVVSHCDADIKELYTTPITLPIIGGDEDIDKQERELTDPLNALYGKGSLTPIKDMDEVLSTISETANAPIAIKSYGERIDQRQGE